jgi:hypothetical protein
MVYNSNDYCNAAQYSGASSDYMHMSPIYNVLGGGNNVYGGILRAMDTAVTDTAVMDTIPLIK